MLKPFILRKLGNHITYEDVNLKLKFNVIIRIISIPNLLPPKAIHSDKIVIHADVDLKIRSG